jgi:hypothetical protein
MVDSITLGATWGTVQIGGIIILGLGVIAEGTVQIGDLNTLGVGVIAWHFSSGIDEPVQTSDLITLWVKTGPLHCCSTTLLGGTAILLHMVEITMGIIGEVLHFCSSTLGGETDCTLKTLHTRFVDTLSSSTSVESGT